MLFLICLDPLLNKRIHKASANIGYHEHNNEEVTCRKNFIKCFCVIDTSLISKLNVCDFLIK